MLTKKELLKDAINCPRPLSDFYFQASCNWSVRNVSKIRSELRKALAHKEVGEYLDNIIVKYNLRNSAGGEKMQQFIETAFRADYDKDLVDTINEMHNKHALIGWLATVRCFIDSNFPVTFDAPLTRSKIKSLLKNDNADYYLYKYQKQKHLEYFHNLLIIHCRLLLNRISYAGLDEEGKKKAKIIFMGAAKKQATKAQGLMSESFMFECKGAIEYFQDKISKENSGKKRVIALT